MTAAPTYWAEHRDDEIARLTHAAYRAVLERGYRGSFLDLELSLWNTLRQLAGDPSKASEVRAENGGAR